MNVMRRATAFLDWIATYRGFVVSLLAYGAIEFALFMIFNTNKVCRPGAVGVDCAFPFGSFAGTFMPVMQVTVVGMYLIAIARRIWLTISDFADFDLGEAVLDFYLNVRWTCVNLVNPLISLPLAGLLALFMKSEEVDQILTLGFIGQELLAAYKYLVIDLICGDLWGQMGGGEFIIFSTFFLFASAVVVIIEGMTPFHRYLVERGLVPQLHWVNL